jgi:ABC-2 type transport system ATP-binding protein
MNNMIEVKNLSKSYGSLKAVHNLTLSVKKGMVFGLLGANGAGKSTTIECILGTKKLDSGHVSILGLQPTNNRKALFEKVGVQFQEAHYQEHIQVGELCEVTAALYKRPADYHELLSQFGLKGKEKTFIKELSGGQKQRLFIILALIPNPDLIFLDELTTGLDAKARRDVWAMIMKLKQEGLSVFLSSHFMDEIEVLCDLICILSKGETVFYGTVNEAIEQSPFEKLEDAYLWYTGEEVVQNENV